MTVRKMASFNPETLISAPRRSAGIPNPSATKLIYSESTYSFEKQSKTSEIRVLDLKTDESTLLSDDKKYSNPCWLDDGMLALLRSTDEDTTELVLGPYPSFAEKCYVAGTIDGPTDNLKITQLGYHSGGVAVSAQANPDGSIYNPKKAPKARSTGKLYKSLFVRHWDHWITPQRNAIFYGALLPGKEHRDDNYTEYSLSPMTNALKDTTLESPVPEAGGDTFDISKSGILFVAKDPTLDPAMNTKCNLYTVPLETFEETTSTMTTAKTDGYDGVKGSPKFSVDGSKAVFLAMKQNGYESDMNHILMLPDITRPEQVERALPKDVDTYYNPQSLYWSTDGDKLYWLAEINASRALFGASLTELSAASKDWDVTSYLYSGLEDGSLEDVVFARGNADGRDRLLLSSSSLTKSSIYTLADVIDEGTASTVSYTNSYGGPQFGLSQSQVQRIYSKPGDPHGPRPTIESLMILPSHFNPTKTYPLALLIHGGPQGAWLNAWSTRWNPAVFAEQGYIVLCPNITGSTSYGQPFTDAIKENWGGTPYLDLLNLFAHLESIDYIDTDRAVALGASYGGYMVNWLQGHALGRKFKALVTHDGVFSPQFGVATDELYFMHHDFGGAWVDPKAREGYRKWDPSLHTENWATPHLIIHSERDFRLGIGDGLAAFNCLRMRGIESEFLTFPGENHFVLGEEDSLCWHGVVLGWCNSRVGLKAFESKFWGEGVVRMDPERGLGDEEGVKEVGGGDSSAGYGKDA